jgi:hypothetical protein
MGWSSFGWRRFVFIFVFVGKLGAWTMREVFDPTISP